MPGFDGTGPQGQGPMTGGGRGYCAVPLNSTWAGWGGRHFYGRGRGRGFRNCYWATWLPGWMRSRSGMQASGRPWQGISTDEELAMLKAESEALSDYLKNIHEQIQRLENSKQKPDA